MNDNKLSHILSNESASSFTTNSMNKSDVELSVDNGSKSPSRLLCSSPTSRDKVFLDSQGRRLKKYENDDISQEKVVRIYQQELAKLMGRKVEEYRGFSTTR